MSRGSPTRTASRCLASYQTTPTAVDAVILSPLFHRSQEATDPLLRNRTNSRDLRHPSGGHQRPLKRRRPHENEFDATFNTQHLVNHENRPTAHTSSVIRGIADGGNAGLPDLTEKVVRTESFSVAFGGFADVFRGTYVTHNLEMSVAIKVLRHYADDAEEVKMRKQKKLRRELEIRRRLSHDYVLPLLGTVSHFGVFPSMVCPWAEKGNLTKFLGARKDTLDATDRLRMLAQIAAGMNYLHDNDVVHGDLTGDEKCLICDFGLSTAMDLQGTSYLTSSMAGSIRWAAPELLTPDGSDTNVSGRARVSKQSVSSPLVE